MTRKQKWCWPFYSKQKKNENDGDATGENSLMLQDISSYHPNDLLNYHDGEGRNLLIIAVNEHDIDKVKELLQEGHDPNSSHNGRLAVSIAYENGDFDIVLALLENDSRFPPDGFNADDISHDDLKAFVAKMRQFHAKLKSWQELTDSDVEEITQTYPNLRHIYGIDGEDFNCSAVYVCMMHQKVANLDTLKCNKFICTNEELDILRKNTNNNENIGSGVDGRLNQNEIAASDPKLPESLCLKSFLGAGLPLYELKKRYDAVWTAFNKLNKIDEMKPLLKFLVVATNLRIVFDFEREHCESFDLQVRNNAAKNIYIGARKLLSQQYHEILEIYATIAREIARYVIGEIYHHKFPKEFSDAVVECNKNRRGEPLISNVFTQRIIRSKELELLAIVPQLIVSHENKENELAEKRKKFPLLFQLYQDTVLPEASKGFTSAIDEVNIAVTTMDESDGLQKKMTWIERNRLWLVGLCLFFTCAIVGISIFFYNKELPQSDRFHGFYNQCGEIKVKILDGKDLIVGPSAESAYHGQWPWLGALFVNVTVKDGNTTSLYNSFVCGSSLITPWHLLTAAHCTKYMTFENFYVLLGRYNLTDDSETHFEKRTMSALYTHPDYNLSRVEFKSRADIAIFRMTQKVLFTDFIQPICFPHPWATVIDVSGIVAGYGKHNNRSLHENLPKFARLETINATECLFSKKEYANIVSRRSFCATHFNGTASPCTGDSGGGFYVETGEAPTRYMVTGVVSQALNSNECDPKDNVVFVNVMDFREWIIEKVSNCTDSEDCVDPCDLNPCGKGLICRKGAKNNTHRCV